MIAARPLTGLAVLLLACGPQTGTATESDTGTGTTTTGTTTDTDPTGDTGVPVPACDAGKGDPGGDLRWSRSGDALPGFLGAVAVAPDHRLVLAGSSGPLSGDLDVVVEARDPDGALAWTDTYKGESGLADRPLGLAIDPEGFIHVLVYETVLQVIGETSGTSDARLVVLRYTPEGGKVWRWERERPPVEPFEFYDPSGRIAVTDDGIIVLERAHDHPDVRLALDRFGNLTAEAVLELPKGVFVEHSAIAPDGTVLLAGDLELPNGRPLWFGRFAAGGALLWNDSFGGIDDNPTAIVPGRDGDVYLAWTTRLPGDDENRVRRYDAAGTPTWTRELPLTGLDVGAHGGAVRCDGVLLLTGSTELPPDPAGEWGMRKDLWLAAFAADGTELWSTLHRFGTPDSYGEGHRLAAAYDGDAIVVGSFLAPSGSTYLPWLGRFSGG